MPDLIYLDNASTSWPKPAGVGDAMARAVAEPLGSPGRGAGSLAAGAAALATRLRESLAARVGASDPQRIVLTTGATESLNIALLGLLSHRGDRPRVITTAAEHNSVRRPLEYLASAGIIELHEIPCDFLGAIDGAAVLACVDKKTALLALSHASNVTGTIQPVEQIARSLRARFGNGDGPLLLIDASATAGLLPLKADEWGLDLIAFSGHKALLGPAGTGALYVSARAYDQAGDPDAQPLRPTRFGGTGADSISASMPAQLPQRFEPGTPNLPGMAGLLAALEDPARGPDATVLAHERAIARRLIELLDEHAGDRVRLLGSRDPAARTGVVALTVSGIAPAEVAAVLEQSFGVVARAGLHCAPAIHRALGTLDEGGALRISPGPATTPAEIQTAARGIAELCRA